MFHSFDVCLFLFFFQFFQNVLLCTIHLAYLLTPNVMPITLLKISTVLINAFRSFSVFAYCLKLSMYSKWSSVCLHIKDNINAVISVWFSVGLIPQR